MRNVWTAVARPWRDYLQALRACLDRAPAAAAALVAAGFAVSWWVYVPVHELLHALGCAATGGTVTRLEIDWIYGAPLLAKVFPFVAVGSAYAGQLTGFDTHGNDLVYLATDFLPFVLTIVVGVPMLRCSARRHGSRFWSGIALGVALPIAYAPFVSVTGDYYEMGSIVVTRCMKQWSPAFPVTRWRSDDVFRLVSALRRADGSLADALGVAAALTLGVVLAFATYWLGGVFSDFLERHRRAQLPSGAR
jgi:hypothetical protein